jgi:hypothetical protein
MYIYIYSFVFIIFALPWRAAALQTTRLILGGPAPQNPPLLGGAAAPQTRRENQYLKCKQLGAQIKPRSVELMQMNAN